MYWLNLQICLLPFKKQRKLKWLGVPFLTLLCSRLDHGPEAAEGGTLEDVDVLVQFSRLQDQCSINLVRGVKPMQQQYNNLDNQVQGPIVMQFNAINVKAGDISVHNVHHGTQCEIEVVEMYRIPEAEGAEDKEVVAERQRMPP